MASILRLDQLQNLSGTNVVSFDNSGNATFQNGVKLPVYTNSNRPTGQLGLTIYNSESGRVETFDGQEWFSAGGKSLDGSSQSRAALSAANIKLLNPFASDGVYWINLPTVGPTQIYCIMDTAYDGGGWMMMMKATRGTTFPYTSNYWTTINTLNPSQTNRSDGDAKFDTMNYFQAKDMMALWPDITALAGGISGSISNLPVWSWLENNFNDGARITPVNFFNISYPTMNAGGSGKFIRDAKTFSGWRSGIFSSQVDVRFYGFNYTNNPQYGTQAKVRWGFGWNENGEGLYPSSFVSAYGSNDVSGGIGMDTSYGSYSAGDRIGCCNDTTGINRTARVEIYVR